MSAGFFSPPRPARAVVVDYFLPRAPTLRRRDTSGNREHIRTLDGVTGTNSVVGDGHLRFMLIYESGDRNSSYGKFSWMWRAISRLRRSS
jgi:hypothetical protein